MRGCRLPDALAMARERSAEGLIAEATQEISRAFDVSEHEGHRAGRKRWLAVADAVRSWAVSETLADMRTRFDSRRPVVVVGRGLQLRCLSEDVGL
jgi:hypothetical protein